MDIRSKRDLYIALTAPAIGILTAKLVYNLYQISTHNGVPISPKIHKAPSTRALTPSEEESIPYPPDALPGGRNIDTPYGNIRAYEWGPENGRKVLFVHGISTPCISLARMAKQLVKQGCRVCLFDLPGRGYSDCPDTTLFRQDTKLFSALILAVVSTSPLSWTGSASTDGFTLVGYSLGGGIAAAFTAHYPDLISSLILIAPGGLLRPTRLSWSSRILYSGILPDSVTNFFVSRRLRITAPTSKATQARLAQSAVNRRSSLSSAVQEELPEDFDPHAPGQDSLSPIFDDRPNVSPATAVAWQVDANPGFVPAFISCIKYAPIHDGFEMWKKIGERCAAARAQEEKYADFPTTLITSSSSTNSNMKHARYGSDSSPGSPTSSTTSFSKFAMSSLPTRGLDEGKVLVILGTRDVIIMPEETAQDVTAALGKANVKLQFVQGGHDLVLSNTDECVDIMGSFWEGR